MTANYSFFTGNNVINNTGITTTTERPMSPAQEKYYSDLCSQRNIIPVDLTGKSYDEVSLMIKELREFFPASPAQINLIKEKASALNIDVDEEKLSKLTGGREGSASKLIAQLIEKEREVGDTIEPTEAQIQYLVSMFYCVDVCFEDHDIKKRVNLEEGLWRLMTPSEFAEEIKSKMNRKEASAFIDKYRGAHHAWLNTRISLEQERYIRQLEDRLADLYVPQQTPEYDDGKKKPRQYNPIAYEPLSEGHLKMFSRDEASKYIDRLKYELEAKQLYSNFNSQQHDGDLLDFISRSSRETDIEEAQNALFKIFSHIGYETEEVLNSISEKLFLDDTPQEKEIKDFFEHIIEEGSITDYTLQDMLEGTILSEYVA